MPGWHDRTKNPVADGKLQVFGIAPEQYGDRMALFLQWKKMDFPVLMDPLNVLGVTAVPITLLVDESGVIRYLRPKPQDLATFLETDYPETEQSSQPPARAPHIEQALEALQSGKIAEVKEAMASYRKLVEADKAGPADLFHLGVLHRWCYDHDPSDSAQFQDAVDHWQAALQEVPGQYIWRRRIQQFGPRLDKPYPFYNWVEEARGEISAREDSPFPLLVEPSGSEVSSPRRKNEQKDSPKIFPDPGQRLPDSGTALQVTVTLIPHTDQKEERRLHLRLQPTGSNHWSSDAQEASLWLVPQEGEPILLTDQPSPLTNGKDTSGEARTLEADLSRKPDEDSRLVLFFSLCEDEQGVCRFLKKEISLTEKSHP
ncbi:TlpA family protein disulfide reductase [Roseibacillus persicicus]|uniref:TlpA family protein disulfide reductase n=1 Tax=Roseibacillus persicicus TaxID=454148 RepID=UPI00280F9201|nr:hypothetical protein [Roseibacillus persicicus]MDQ8189392.1 hypothetical protein [Roseibacillus persicicus]